ncbi:gephyrin-like molybdotransferase Glp [Sulfobacillus harzensis]|uniref:Molybdopterin molybdenumtransferase n=1 Tax=Sulfobacillus harzensis TaxID=2729629 RepID=A0A7Y0L2P0_9FIRM|nr:gephyrin-like molybdotransferase Glp [Sulfobacillus harzensis]NMP21973.1 molybdopterin molybdotransferase MoeA [Sulfobacillus harzensis]
MSYISVDEARALLLARISTALRRTDTPLNEALGRVLADDIQAPSDWPPFSRAAMDGYAFRSANTPGTFQVVGTLYAGAVWTKPLMPGEALRIMTGAPIPEGADTVLEQERVTEGPVIAVLNQVRPGRNIMVRGHEYRLGDPVIPAGTRLGPLDVGQLAALGIDRVPTVLPPRVTVLSTGDEVASTTVRPLKPGQIYDANGALLAALYAETFGCRVRRLHVPDQKRRLIAALEKVAPASDLIITTGGVSVGAHDYIPTLMEDRYQRLFWRVDMHPGKAAAAALVHDGTIWLGLSGNPGAMLTEWYLLVAPITAQIAGWSWPERRVRGRLARPYSKPTRETRYLKAHFRRDPEGLWFDLIDNQSSDAIRSFRDADGLVIVPHESPALPAETELEALVLPFHRSRPSVLVETD